MTTTYPEKGANTKEDLLSCDSSNKILDALINIEDNKHDSQRLKYYRIIEQCLDDSQPLTKPVLKRILNVCCQELNEAKPSMLLVTVFDIISKITPDILKYPGVCEDELEKTASALLRHLKNISGSSKPYYIVTLGFKILLSYPDKILIKIAVNNAEDIFSIASLFFQDKVFEVTLNNNLIDLIIRVLKLLPTQQKKQFVECGLNIWFGRVIPALMHQILFSNSNVSRMICLLELLTEVLVYIDYSRHHVWLQVLKSCCANDKYPACLTTALKQGKPYWHTVWSIFIKLLKTQITQNFLNMGTPINSMLSVVETAFKMSVVERCRAFQCWNVLIDNFAQDSVEPMLKKRIKLLMIPLNSNNAKVEETALSKFDTWWHFIIKFQNKIQLYTNVILIPFLEYCFGKCDSDIIPPGLMYASVTNLGVYAFTEIVGHDSHCNGCVADSFPRLEQKLLNSQLLVNYLPQWMHTFKQTIKIILQNNSTSEAERRVYCLWNSFFLLLVSLPENNLRRDVVAQQLQVLSDLTIHEDNHTAEKMAPVLFKLITQLAKDDRFKALLNFNSKDDIKSSPVCILVNLILSPLYCNMCARLDLLQIISNVKPLIDIAIYSTNSLNQFLEWLLEHLAYDDIGFALWMSIVELIPMSDYDFETLILCSLFMWPLNGAATMPDKVMPQLDRIVKCWYSLYNHIQKKLNAAEKLAYKTLFMEKAYAQQETLIPLLVFNFTVLDLKTALIIQSVSFNLAKYKKEIMWLTSNIRRKELNLDKKMCAEVADILHLILKVAKYSEDTVLVESLLCATMNLMPELLSDDNEENFALVEIILKEFNTLFLKKEYQSSIHLIVDQLVTLACHKKVNYEESVLEILLKCCENNKLESQIKVELETAIAEIKNTENKRNLFTTPKQKKEPKVIKKNIDGEGFVVVYSHWKFNPKKLTEHQKEILNKRREDIPALYQDLSQSQDECKMISWKGPDGDSQNTSFTSSSNSISKEAENFSSELKKFPNMEIVPKILNNIKINVDNQVPVVFNKNPLKMNSNNNNEIETVTSNVINKKHSMNVQALTPRLSIKDRVVQNMNSLAKYSVHFTENVNDTNETTRTIPTCDIPSIPVSPSTEAKCIITNSTHKVDQNSTSEIDVDLTDSVTPASEGHINKEVKTSELAPTVTTVSERPPRIKRKPKKLIADFTELPLKRRKHSITLSNSLMQDSQVQGLSKGCEDSELSNHNIHVNETGLDELHCGQVIGSNNNIQLKEINHIHEFQTTNETAIKNDVKERGDIELLCKGSLTKELQNSTNVPKKERKDRKSRLEKELEIDMVEGHPFLSASQLEKRKSRKSANENSSKANNREQKQSININESKEDCNVVFNNTVTESMNSENVMEKNAASNHAEDLNQELDMCHNLPQSEDFIESSQDSTVSMIPAKTPKRPSKKQTQQTLTLLKSMRKSRKSKMSDSIPANQEALNAENGQRLNPTQNDFEIIDTTANMDTQPLTSVEENMFIISPHNEKNRDTELNNSETVAVDIASTEPLDSCVFSNDKNAENNTTFTISRNASENKLNEATTKTVGSSSTSDFNVIGLDRSQENSITGLSSPFKDEIQRNEDFLNNTLDISPIKPSSPLNDDKNAQSPKHSEEYVVITLSSPVQSNGEPADASNSPEMFNDIDKFVTKDKSPMKDNINLVNVSPEKLHQSPPREMASFNNNSPRSLSLKRNRPQMKPVGRAAHMLGCVLGVSNKYTFLESEKCDDSVDIKNSPHKKPVRRNLKNSYEDREDNEIFLKFSKELPSANSSPSCPILKRKHANIDDVNISPASKRKRVSFHDPPVSTTVVVQKYIDPASIKVPIVRVTDIKCFKRQTNEMKLTTANVSNENDDDTLLEDIDTSSFEQTPQVEIVKNSDLNDTDPICPELINCEDPITKIALDLSSPAMKELLVKELQGKVETVGDLAKLTELEVNRLCIKAPKVVVAKKVLTEYAATKMDRSENDKNVTNSKATLVDVDIQTLGVPLKEVGIQSDIETLETHSQTINTSTKEVNVQTDEETSAQIMKLLLKIPNFIDSVDKDSKDKILDTLSIDDIAGILKQKAFSPLDIKQILNCLLRHDNFENSLGADDEDESLTFLKNYVCDSFSSRNIIRFCSSLLSNVYKKM